MAAVYHMQAYGHTQVQRQPKDLGQLQQQTVLSDCNSRQQQLFISNVSLCPFDMGPSNLLC